MTDEQRKKAAKALVETYLGFPAPDREPCALDLKAVDAVIAILAASAPNPSDKQEAVAEIVRYDTFAGRTAWDIKIRDTSLKNGALLYAAPLAQSAEQDRIDAERRAEYWKAEHLAGNNEIERLKAALESRVLAERKQEAVALTNKQIDELGVSAGLMERVGKKQIAFAAELSASEMRDAIRKLIAAPIAQFAEQDRIDVNGDLHGYYEDGRSLGSRESLKDLFMAPAHLTRYVNLFPDGVAYWFDTEAEARAGLNARALKIAVPVTFEI